MLIERLISLRSNIYVIAIAAETKAAVFKDWRVGDKIYFETDLKHKTKKEGRNRIFASDFLVTNITQGTCATGSQTKIAKMFSSDEGIFTIIRFGPPEASHMEHNTYNDLYSNGAAFAMRSSYSTVDHVGGTDK